MFEVEKLSEFPTEVSVTGRLCMSLDSGGKCLV